MTWHDYPVRINPDITAKYDNQFVNVAVDKGGNVYVAYSDNHGIFYQYSTNHGQTFSAPSRSHRARIRRSCPGWRPVTRGKIDLVYYQAAGYSGNPEVAPLSVAWKVVMAQSLAAASSRPAFNYTTVNPVVHHGGVCEGGALCTGNRDLYDDFGVEASPTTGLGVDHLLRRPVPERRQPQAEPNLRLHHIEERHLDLRSHERRDANSRHTHFLSQGKIEPATKLQPTRRFARGPTGASRRRLAILARATGAITIDAIT